MWRKAAVIGLITPAITLGAASASASAESLTILLGVKAEAGEPYSIQVEVDVNAASRLYVYVDAGGASCAAGPAEEATYITGVVALSTVEGEAVGSGAVARRYIFTPASDGGYSVCAYVLQPPDGPVDLSAHADFGVTGGPAPASYLNNPQLQEEIKRIAVEHEQQEEQERQQARQRLEEGERERIPATEYGSPESPPVAHILATPLLQCIVPSLRNHSLVGARHALQRAHCALGRVERPRHLHGELVVTRQSARRGRSLPSGARVGIVLGPRHLSAPRSRPPPADRRASGNQNRVRRPG
jgi:hypothetical protein